MAPQSTNGDNTQTTTRESEEQTGREQGPVVSRKQIGIRLLLTILFLLILGIVITIVKVLFLFQFIYFFSTQKPNEPVRQFTNSLCTYGYRVLRYITLNESQCPFPLDDWPSELEPSDEQIAFDWRR